MANAPAAAPKAKEILGEMKKRLLEKSIKRLYYNKPTRPKEY